MRAEAGTTNGLLIQSYEVRATKVFALQFALLILCSIEGRKEDSQKSTLMARPTNSNRIILNAADA